MIKKSILLFSVLALCFTVNIGPVQASNVSEKITITKRTAHKVYFKWNKVENADKYLTRIVTQKNKKLVTKKRSKDNKAVISGLNPNKKYQIKVKAKVNNKYRKNSDAKKFTTTKGSLYLTGEDYSTTVNWESSLEATNGYKLIWSKSSGPEYPTRSGDKYQYYANSNTDEGEISAFNGDGTYYVRVCEYVSGGCEKYSNQIKVDLEDDSSEDPESTVTAITLSEYQSDCSNSTSSGLNMQSSSSCYNVQWEADGVSSNGYKLIWSKNANPEYPTRSGDDYNYYSSSNQEKGFVSADSGTYYVRVCEYLGGECGVYSNQITLDL